MIGVRHVNAFTALVLVASTGAGIISVSGIASSATAEPMAGGYRDVAATDPGVQAAARFGVAQLHRPRARLASVDAAQQQVVAGMNYRIDVTLTDRSRWRLSIYRPLRGPMQARPAERLAPAGHAH